MPNLHPLCAVTLSAVVGALTTSCGSSDTIVIPPEGWVLTTSDEFDSGTSLSPELWTIETGYGPEIDPPGWGNDEWQLYTDSPDNVRIEDGNLVITALCAAPCAKRDGSITSARIKTKFFDCDGQKCGFEQKHGRIEARIKLPEGQGIWPAFWMLGGNIDEVPWPSCGEIDIVENFGREPERVDGSLHGPGYSGGQALSRGVELPGGESFADDFHVYAVEWDPSRIAYSVDGDVYQIIGSGDVRGRRDGDFPQGEWVFNNEFFVLLNVAVGGNPVPAPSETSFPAEMLVDYVRFFERDQ